MAMNGAWLAAAASICNSQVLKSERGSGREPPLGYEERGVRGKEGAGGRGGREDSSVRMGVLDDDINADGFVVMCACVCLCVCDGYVSVL